MIDRPSLLRLLRTSALAARHDFLRSAALDWLAVWPGDTEVQHLLAQAEIELGREDLAIERLQHLLAVDPEDTPAYFTLADCLRRKGDVAQARVYTACGRALRGVDPDRNATPAWAAALSRAIRALGTSDIAAALQQAALALSADPDTPLPTLITLRAHLALGDQTASGAVAASARTRWPHCTALRLVHALALLQAGQMAEAVDALHRAAVEDPTGAIAQRWLGASHPYRSLWPADLVAELGRPVPADVAAAMGDNRLAAGPSSPAQAAPPVPPSATEEPAFKAPPDEDDDLPRPEPWEAFRGPHGAEGHLAEEGAEAKEIQRDIARMAIRVKGRKSPRADHERRVPSYILLSSETRLLQQFGPAASKQIDQAMQQLADAVRHRKGWTSHRIYVDDPGSLSPFGLAPADPANAWQIKLRLADLDAALRRKGEMIGALLIVGGDGIIPFHRLPNPTDDDDEIVPSDNPYAATDENYFAPEWPVGRLPVDHDAALITRLLASAAKAHRTALQPARCPDRLRAFLRAWFGRLLSSEARAFGYSASIWRRSSMAVYRSIGSPRSMVTSPPVEAGALPAAATRGPHLSYFNLHGLEDAPEWFGQRDPLREPDATEYPIALRPQDVVNGGRAPRVVFTEACYGAHVLGKTTDTALSLKFLESGCSVVVGSTKIAYGSITTPLIAADMLGRSFWDNLTSGLPAGEALRRAKLDLAAEMVRRQGYLDGEDQKTLISFVLYGDPLYILTPGRTPLTGKAIARQTHRPTDLRTTCALGECMPDGDAQGACADRVRTIVAQYLPGMADAETRIHSQRFTFPGQIHADPLPPIGGKHLTDVPGPGTTVVTLSKSISVGDRRHARYAHLTLDPSGKVLKLAVSR